MKLSPTELDYIVSLSKSEKPQKYIKMYLESLDLSKERVERQTKFYNKVHKGVYNAYFARFTGRYREECTHEAYVSGLECLRNGADVDVAFTRGCKAGAKLFELMSKETLKDSFEENYNEHY